MAGRLRREFFGGIGRDVNAGRVFQTTECCSQVTVLQGHDQIDDAASAIQTVVVSQISDVIDAETRRAFLA